MNITSSVTKSAGTAITGIGAAINNSGSIAVDSGQLNFSYSYSQTPSGTLEVKIGGDADFDTFPVANAAALDGNLNIILTGGYEPTLDKTFEIMTAPSVTGQFSVVNGTAIVAGRKFDVLYTANNVTLKVVSD